MKPICFLLSIFVPISISSNIFASDKIAKGNQTFQSFNKAKKVMERYVISNRRLTLYCQAPFDKDKNIILPNGFTTASHAKRAGRVEWEHVVPAENFGRFFPEWREGSSGCIDNKGRPFKGRKCAEKENITFRYMQSDLYNLYPAIGAVNAERGNKNFEELSKSIPNSFGTCAMKITENKVEPPTNARGPIARTYKYMAYAYPNYFRMSSSQSRLMDAWDKAYPVQEWECERAVKIKQLQGNDNPFVLNFCKH